MSESAAQHREDSVFSFRPDAMFYVRSGLSVLGVFAGTMTALTGVLVPLGPVFGVVGVVSASVSGWSLRNLRRSWRDRPELLLGPHGVWLATVNRRCGLFWTEIAHLGTGLHQGSEHLVARPITPSGPVPDQRARATAREVGLPWSQPLQGYVVAPTTGWDRPDTELRAAAQVHAEDRWLGPFDGG